MGSQRDLARLKFFAKAALPDDLIAIASSTDKTRGYNLEAPFSDNLGGHFAGGEWRADATHNMLATVTNGGTRVTDALLTLHYDNGKKKYETQQTIQPGEQMRVNFAALIHNRVPDRKGNVLSADVVSGTYDLQDLSPGPGSLLQGNLALDTTWGHHGAPPPGPTCCAVSVVFNPPAMDLLVNILDAPLEADGVDQCSNIKHNVSGEIDTKWSDNPPIAQVTTETVTAVAPGFTGADGSGLFLEGQGSNCVLKEVQVEAPVTVGPLIKWNNAYITGTTQSAVVGQQIALTTEYTVPPGVIVQSRSWTVAGTTVGGYNATSSSGATVATDFVHDSATFYWVYPSPAQGPFSVTFTLNLSGGAQVSATTSFNVAGPTAVSLFTCGGNVPSGCAHNGPLGTVAIDTGPVLRLGGPASNIGIAFTASATPPSGYANTFSYVQLIKNDPITLTPSNGGAVQVCNPTTQPVVGVFPALDSGYPYSKGTTTSDNPPTATLTNTDKEVTRAFSATMYLMWSSELTGSIPVPLGYVDWQFTADATLTNSQSNTWAVKSGTGSAGSFVASNSFPVWASFAPYTGETCHNQ